MQNGAELDLPYLTMEADAFAADPYPHFAAARAQHPWLARWTLGYVVTDYQAMRDIYGFERHMRQLYHNIVDIMDAKGTPWGRFQESHILNQSGASHKKLRDLLAPHFTPREANARRPLMREVMTRLLDEWAPKGGFDFEEFASYYPITVMCTLIGADPAVIPGLRSAMEAIGLSTSMDRRWLPQMQEGVVTMERFCADLIADRRAHPRTDGQSDLLDLLLRTNDSGGLTDQELIDLLIFLFVGGYDTSKNMLTLTMNELVRHPDIYRRCADDYDFVRKVLNESFRMHGTTSTQRILDQDIVYRDVRLEKDSIVWFPMSVATHDVHYVDGPDRFDPERPQEARPISFGLGPHICLGQYIARAQIHEGLHLIAQRLLNPRSPGPDGWRPFPGAWGIRGLPITFDTAAVH
jgi:cytochrome P450